jgi:Ca-activated chloride channel family protein
VRDYCSGFYSLAEETGGLYITAENRQDLIRAFEKTLGCPMMSAR